MTELTVPMLSRTDVDIESCVTFRYYHLYVGGLMV